MTVDPILAFLSLIKKSGNVISGETAVLEAIRSHHCFLVIFPADASENAKKRYRDKCTFYEIPYIEYGTRALVGHAIGCGERVGIGITEKNMAENLQKKITNRTI